MADDHQGDLLSSIGSGLTGLTPVTQRRARPAGSVKEQGRSGGGSKPNGPRGRRMLSADTSIDSLDRRAPRGTYLDLLV